MNAADQRTFDVIALTEMGLSQDEAERALKKWPTVEAAANGYFEGNLDKPDDPDDVPPPLPEMPRDEPPAYNPFGPQTYFDMSNPTPGGDSKRITTTPERSTAVTLYDPPPGPPPVIDLTGDDDTVKQQDTELQRAIKLSTEGDSEMDKALALSISDLRTVDSSSGSGVASIAPEKRYREPNQPPILRPLSPLLTLLASYIQCLFAVPTWRKAVLEYRPTQADLGSVMGFEGVWKGEGGELEGSLAPKGNARWGMIALQRLFALMITTKRSFLHIEEIVKHFSSAADLSRTGADAVSCIKTLHIDLVDRFKGETTTCVYQQGMSTDEHSLYTAATGGPIAQEETRRASRFEFHGRQVDNSESIGILPGQTDEQGGDSTINLVIDPTSPHRQTIYTSLDSTFVTTSSTSVDAPLEEEDTSFALLTTLPDTLVFSVQRQLPAFTTLDSFGGGDGASKRRVFEVQETIWMDRYHVDNRVKIRKGRARARELKKEVEEVREKRDRLAVTKDGHDGVQLVRQTVAYLEDAASTATTDDMDDGDDEEDVTAATPVDEERRARQAKLAEQYRAVLKSMESQIAAYDARLIELQTELDAIFDTDSMRQMGPYQLSGVLMRNGLNGRGSSWSVVRDVEGRWWKIVDLLREEVKLEDALEDPSGLYMNAGATMLFYQRTTAPLELAEIPPLLAHLALADNHSFAAELPDEITSTWDLASLSSRPPSPDPLSALPGDVDASPVGDFDHVDVQAHEIIDYPNDRDYSPPAAELKLDDEDVMGATPIAELMPESSLVEEKMSVDGEVQHIEMVTEDEAMRLRGGAADEEEEEYSDEEYDEDEVELGCLKEMPEEWDVDFAVGKVGGLPKFLDPRSPLSPKDVECGVCGGTMSLLLQVNSPDDERPHAAARALYVFACRGKDCMTKDSSKAIKVWRLQMASPNEFFPHTDETQKRRKELEEGIKSNAGLSAPPTSSSTAPWPEWDVACESEPYEESYLPDSIEKSNEDGANGEDAAEPDTRTGVDAAFLAFQDRIERVPEQVLRFYRLPGIEDPQPLWANNKKAASSAIPSCSLCNGPRQVEFQIVSTLLNFLKDDHFQFDSLLVYTCVSNCEIPPRAEGRTGWVEEFVVEDKFTSAGVVFGQAQ